MRGECRRVKRIERFYVLEELIELGIDLQRGAPILPKRIREAVERQDKALGALAQQRRRRSLRGKLRVRGGQSGQQRSRGAVTPI